MGHYLFNASYSVEGLRGVLQEGAASRLKAVKKLVSSLGGKVETAYWSFGKQDFVLIAELPDNAAAAALATSVSASGLVAITTTVLLSADEIDTARGLTPAYRAPGQ